MPSSDVAGAIGGRLKLKGSRPDGVEKKKKKKKPKSSSTEQSALRKASADEDAESSERQRKTDEEVTVGQERKEDDREEGFRKTETEKKFEEMQRKRLEEKIKREGIKTHKERVEELNKYLSNLSEHHDMYVPNSVNAIVGDQANRLKGQGLDQAKMKVSAL
ncbi:MAG: hypothetical protein M1820_000432 [Bogoriella megaspora]|nr:MAG: hypothetical protein M1820_000432 [Bogoriella megaspora]